jgi:hypothetical protein
MELLTEIERIKSVMGLVTEVKKKLTRDEKFFWVSKNIGGWLYDEIFYTDYDLNRLPFFEMYKIYLTRKTRVNRNSREAVGQSLKDHYEDFLNIMEPQKSEDVIDEIKRVFPSIKDKIDSYGRKEKNPNERRGRKKLEKKPVVTSAIRQGRTDIDMSRLRPLSAVQQAPEPVIEPVNVPEPRVAAKRGRKKLERDYTYIEAGRWKKEGIEQLEKMEKRIDKYEAKTTELTNEIIRLQRELDRRRRFFGITQDDAPEDINESIQKIKSDFKRFIL